MHAFLRLLLAAVALAVLVFAIVGFLATLEPMAPSLQRTWRIVYAALGVAAALALVRLGRARGSR